MGQNIFFWEGHWSKFCSCTAFWTKAFLLSNFDKVPTEHFPEIKKFKKGRSQLIVVSATYLLSVNAAMSLLLGKELELNLQLHCILHESFSTFNCLGSGIL